MQTLAIEGAKYNIHVNALAPTAEEQYRILGDYVSRPYSGHDRWATIRCIYADEGSGPRRPPVPNAPPSEGERFLAETGKWSEPPSGAPSPPAPGPTPRPVSEPPPPPAPSGASGPYEVYSFEGGF